MRENELKKKFTQWMDKGAEYLYLEELGIRQGLCIVDVVWLDSDEFIGVELKTKYDTLERLPRQVGYMLSIFDRVVVCLHEKHLQNYDKLGLSECVKVISYDDWEVFTVRSDGSTNEKVQKHPLAMLLWHREMASLVRQYDVDVDPRSRKYILAGAIARELTHTQLRVEVTEAMIKRLGEGEWRDE